VAQVLRQVLRERPQQLAVIIVKTIFFAKFKFCVEFCLYKNSNLAEKGLAGG
jgi:hypothetical protein